LIGAAGARSGVAGVLDAKGVMEPYEEPRQARGWLILLLGIVVFAAFGVVVGYAYYKGLPGIGGEPPLIKAEPGAYRRAPDERGGLAVANANSSIVTVLRQQGEAPRVERLLPPETAAPLEAAEPDAEADTGGPATQPAVQSTPVAPVAGSTGEVDAGAAVPVPASKPAADVQSAAVEPPVTSDVPPPLAAAPSPAAETAPAAPAPSTQRPTRLAAPEPPATAAPAPPSRAAPAPASPAAPPAVAPAQPAASAAPRAEVGPQRLARAEPAVPPPAAVPRAAPGAGVYRLQLAAVRSETGLTQAWADLRQRYPRALATASPQVERTDTSSGPLFRLQAGPFTNRDAAVNACGAIRSSGGQCFIVGPMGE
jgi:hypothetical protein